MVPPTSLPSGDALRDHCVRCLLSDPTSRKVVRLLLHTPAFRAFLPEAVIHADLVPDNIFFLGNELSGVIDFYFACTDFLIYDLAICLNAWCFENDGIFNVTKARLMLSNYRKRRPLSADEMSALPVLARGSALRFLLTRLYDWLNHPAGAFVKPKDPIEYLQKLRFHQGIVRSAAYGLE